MTNFVLFFFILIFTILFFVLLALVKRGTMWGFRIVQLLAAILWAAAFLGTDNLLGAFGEYIKLLAIPWVLASVTALTVKTKDTNELFWNI